jgi:hypothetical protein
MPRVTKPQMPIEIFNFQYIRADQNLFGLIPAGRTAFLSLQKAIDLFAKIAKLTIPMIKKSATKFLCSLFFSISAAAYEETNGAVPFLSCSGCSGVSFANVKSRRLKSVILLPLERCETSWRPVDARSWPCPRKRMFTRVVLSIYHGCDTHT